MLCLDSLGHFICLITMTTYPSKIGLGIAIPLAISLGGATILLAIKQEWGPFAVLSLLSAFVAHLFLSTKYTVEGHTLTIKSGFIINKCIDIHSIRKLTETNNPLSSPAASLDRIEIKYNGYNNILVSPKDKKAFVDQLMAINPAIEVKWKA